MSITAQPLAQARESLISLAQERISLVTQVKEQGRKISDLEREVQKQATLKSQAEQALVDARREIEALRAQVPDEATQNAFRDLVQFLTSPAETHPALRLAA